MLRTLRGQAPAVSTLGSGKPAHDVNGADAKISRPGDGSVPELGCASVQNERPAEAASGVLLRRDRVFDMLLADDLSPSVVCRARRRGDVIAAGADASFPATFVSAANLRSTALEKRPTVCRPPRTASGSWIRGPTASRSSAMRMAAWCASLQQKRIEAAGIPLTGLPYRLTCNRPPVRVDAPNQAVHCSKSRVPTAWTRRWDQQDAHPDRHRLPAAPSVAARGRLGRQ